MTTISKKLKIPEPPVKDGSAKYTGVKGCAECHAGPAKGYQFTKWRTSKHAEAYASLSTPAAYKIAAEMQVREDPRASTACLRCHATAYHEPSGGVLETLRGVRGRRLRGMPRRRAAPTPRRP